MAYDNTGNKYFRCIVEAGGDIGCKIFLLDTIDAETAVRGAAYITDGAAHGVRKGDIVINRRWTTTLPQADSELRSAAAVANILISVFIHFVIGVSATGVPDLTDGLAITATNT